MDSIRNRRGSGYPAVGPGSRDGSSPGPASLHHLLSGSAVGCPLTGFREVRLTRQQYSRNGAARTLARAADQSPPTLTHRQARPFTAERAPVGVSPGRSLLSLLGPTTYCRGGLHTRSRIKDRRPHQKELKLPTSEQFESVLPYLDQHSPRGAFLVRFLTFSGCRIDEARHVKWSDVDFASERLTIRGNPIHRTKNSEIRPPDSLLVVLP